MSANAERFGQIVRARRLALGDLTQLDVWRVGGPSNSTLTAIENGEWSPSGPTFRKLDVALGWEPGSARRAWDGGEPIELEPRRDEPPPVRGEVKVSDDQLGAEVTYRLRRYAEELRKAQRGRETDGATAATTQAAGSAATDMDAVRDAVVEAFRQYVAEVDAARHGIGERGRKADPILGRYRAEFVRKVTALFDQARPISSEDVG